MNPETTILTENIHVGPDSTPEQVQAAVKATMEKVEKAIAAENAKDVAVPEPVNPYADRIFVLPAADAKEGYKPRKRAIVIYPDEKLTQVSTKEEFFGEGLKRLAADLVATATAADAGGLSAIQVGVATRVCVIRISKKPEFVVLVNPEVHPHAHTKMQLVTEGCLSFPGVTEKVERFCNVNVKYQDLDGKHHQMSLTIDDAATASAAQAVQHEVEHLDGKLLLGNLNFIHRDRVKLHMKQVHRKLNTIDKKSGGRYPMMQVLFGYIPDPEPKPELAEAMAEAMAEAPAEA